MTSATGPDAAKERNEKRARELEEALEDVSCVGRVEPGFVGAHSADVDVQINRRKIPAGLLETIAEYGDLRIEGVKADITHASVKL